MVVDLGAGPQDPGAGEAEVHPEDEAAGAEEGSPAA